jgi:hypothetical protein
MRAGTIVMLSGAGVTVLGGVLLWRGWARYRTCTKDPKSQDVLGDFWNAPFVTGMILSPLGLSAFTVGGALALIQSADKG